MIKIATIEDEENIRQEIVRYIKKGIGSIEGVEVDVYESAERYLLVGGRYWLFGYLLCGFWNYDQCSECARELVHISECIWAVCSTK